MVRASVLMFVLAVTCGGCTTRTLTVETDPPGARVILNRREVGDAPVTVPYRYGGINEILVIPHPAGPGGTPYKPALVYHDTWRFALDAPVIDAFAEAIGSEDRQTVRVRLEKNDLPEAVVNERTQADLLEALRSRAEVLRSRAREQFIAAPPRDPAVAPDPGKK